MLAMFLGASSLIAGPASTQPMPTPETLAVRLGIVNYLDEGLSPVFINQAWAGTARAQAYTSSTCCVSLPREWVPGMTMRVEWNSDSMFERGQDALAVRDAPVLPYDISYSGYAWAIFLPGGEVRVQPSASRPDAADFLPGLPPPGEATEAQLKQFIEKTQPKP
ncbi:DUF3304 domain-containing protein [Achromobacter sp. UMC71]|uniref:DUF3304 domain-containing protein n=1 Tax=Achromobacter sp. UMC71 TaxID=1862320 RepID=UPI001603F4C1|nr:DUF3304 domain-containing protein [Achromobacter sp. UMC71]MBB1627864.1 hypothetical protein [Achromobacter sp. UMC71]